MYLLNKYTEMRFTTRTGFTNINGKKQEPQIIIECR